MVYIVVFMHEYVRETTKATVVTVSSGGDRLENVCVCVCVCVAVCVCVCVCVCMCVF